MASTIAFIDQLQGANYSALSSTAFGVAIVDPDSSGLTSANISSLESSGKTLLAYLSVGMANNYRSYWQPGWTTGTPSFILGTAPWYGAYYVAFWNPAWQQIVINQAVALAHKGYNGIDLDVVDVYQLSSLAAADGGIANARADMAKFIKAISVATKAVNPNFKIVQNNALDLLTINPNDPTSATNTAYLSNIDGVLVESTFYLPDNSKPSWSASYLQSAAHAVAAGKTVFSIDYPSSTTAQQNYIKQAIANGFVPYAATPDQSLGPTIESVNYQVPNLLPSNWLSVFTSGTVVAPPPLSTLTFDAPTYAGTASNGDWNLSGVAPTGSMLNIYDRTQVSASNQTGLIATFAVTAANGAWSYTGLSPNSANSQAVAHDFYATVTGASGGSGDYWIGTSGNDTFTFGSEQALLHGGVWGNGGNDIIALSAPATLTDADFANVHLGGLALPSGVTDISTGLALTLNGASAVTLGTNAANAKITTVTAGNGNTSITDGNSGTLTVNASAMAPTATMTLSSGAGAEGFTVTGLAGSLNASAVKGVVTVTATGSAAQRITTGGGADVITAGPSDTITGGAGSDTFIYTSGANSLYPAFNTITDFSVSGTDYFKIGHPVTNFLSLSRRAHGTLSSDLAAVLTSSNFAAQGADLVTLTGSASDAGSYVVINNAGVAGYNGGLDAVIKLTAGAANVHASSFIV